MIKTEKLSIGYDNQIILKDINLHIKEGEYVCIVGANGSGKSTLLKTIIGLNKAIDGKIIINDLVSVGYVPQSLQVSPDFPATVYEIVLSGCLKKMKWLPFYTKKERELANKYLEMLQITSLKRTSFSELSGGQQQRVLIARALCATHKLLFLDEPFSSLDEAMASNLYNIIKRINVEERVTIVIISHDLESILRYATHIIQVDETIIFDGTTEEYISSPFRKSLRGGDV